MLDYPQCHPLRSQLSIQNDGASSIGAKMDSCFESVAAIAAAAAVADASIVIPINL